MAATLTFPDVGEPNLSTASGCGSSYTVAVQDSTISTTSDANYKHTRPRTTKMITTWTYAWNTLTEEQKETLVSFFKQVGTFQEFNFTDWETGAAHVVRFAEPLTYQFVYPRYQVTLKFEEV